MSWPLSTIRSRVRTLSGRPSTAQISDAIIDDYINQYYRERLPLEIEASEFNDILSVEVTNAGDLDEVEFAYGSEYLRLYPPYLLDGIKVGYTRDRSTFRSQWPEDNPPDKSTPETVLDFARTLVFQPAPLVTSTHTFTASCIKMPVTLTADDELPIVPEWGYLIALGAATLIFIDHKQMEDAAALNGVMISEMSRHSSTNARENSDSRAVPAF